MRKILDSNLELFRKRIIKESKRDIELGFLLAEFDFELLLRRMVLHCAKCPTIVIRSLMKKCHGFDRYVDAWNKYVVPFSQGYPLMQDILGIPSKNQIKKGCIAKAFMKRHLLVHGVRTGIGVVNALAGLDVFLESAELLVRFAATHDVDLFTRISPRQYKCMFTSEIKGKNGEALSRECKHGVCGVCPFVGDGDLVSQIRSGIKEQRKARLSKKDVKVSANEIIELAKKYGLENSQQIKSVIDRLNDE